VTDEQPEIDAAIDLAVRRTQSAQRDVADVLEEDQVPRRSTAEVVVHRATDLKDLAHDDDRPEPTRVGQPPADERHSGPTDHSP